MNDRPLIVCLTNSVAANFTANCLLAVGVRPAMVEEPSEAAELAGVADAVLVNLGTLSALQAEAMRSAAKAAARRSVPWVLDPVGVQLLAFRRRFAFELLGLRPSLVRGNPAEIAALGETGLPTLSTGKVDVVLPDGIEISGGVPMLQEVTATGCAQGGICAAFLGRGCTPVEAAVLASRLMKRAGEQAWERAKEPGGFQVALVDALWRLSHD